MNNKFTPPDLGPKNLRILQLLRSFHGVSIASDMAFVSEIIDIFKKLDIYIEYMGVCNYSYEYEAARNIVIPTVRAKVLDGESSAVFNAIRNCRWNVIDTDPREVILVSDYRLVLFTCVLGPKLLTSHNKFYCLLGYLRLLLHRRGLPVLCTLQALWKRCLLLFYKGNKFYIIQRRIYIFLYITARLVGLSNYANNLRYRQLGLDEFLSLSVVDDNELNFLIRARHLSLVTRNFKTTRISDLVALYSNQKEALKVYVEGTEPRDLYLSELPRHLDSVFWDNGNSYFLNCIKFGYREGVLEYSNVRRMMSATGYIMYSNKYYESLINMSDEKILKLHQECPISIREGAVSSGRHRVFSMIGRLARGEPYISFYIDKFDGEV